MSRRGRGRARRRNQRRAILIGGCALIVILVAFFIGYFSVKSAVDEVPKDVIWNNIKIDGVDVSGMNAKEASEALKKKVDEYQKKEVTLIADGTETVVTLEELGFNIEDVDALVQEAVSYGKEGSVWSRYGELQDLEKEALDLKVRFKVDSKVIEKTITEKITNLKNEAKDATIKRENGTFVVTKEKEGKKIDLTQSIKVIAEHFNAGWEPNAGETINLVTVVAEPDIKAEDLKQIQDALGTFSTTFVSGSSRGKNIALATTFINGMVLMPGEEISVSDAMGPRTKENGYLEAGSYLNGMTVQSYGGGICQVSTTLYNAALLAELEITERWAHSMTVDYVKPSMDAAISEGYKDLKFKNNTEAPIYIEGYTSGGTVVFTIYGKEKVEEGRKVSYESEVTSRTAAKKKFVASGDKVGTFKKSISGHDAIKAKLWKVVTVNGSEVSREPVNSSNYATSVATWKVGTATDNAEAKKVLTDAIATQNEDTIKAAITKAQAIIAASSQSSPTTPVAPAPVVPQPDPQPSDPEEGTEQP